MFYNYFRIEGNKKEVDFMKTIKRLMLMVLAICTFTVMKVGAAPTAANSLPASPSNKCTTKASGQTTPDKVVDTESCDTGQPKLTITKTVSDVTDPVTNTFTYKRVNPICPRIFFLFA